MSQSLVGLAVLVQFNGFAILLGIASLVLVAIYPFMKRVTYWPQLFLGLAFSWGALLGWATETGALAWPALVLYLGCIAWTIGYDTIYALQDVEDDALIGVKSTARLVGSDVKPFVAAFYALAAVLWSVAALMVGAGLVFFVLFLLTVAMLAWQVATIQRTNGARSLMLFKSNHWLGAALTAAFVIEGLF